MTEYVTHAVRGRRKDRHRLTVCGLTYLRQLDGSSDPVKAGVLRGWTQRRRARHRHAPRRQGIQYAAARSIQIALLPLEYWITRSRAMTLCASLTTPLGSNQNRGNAMLTLHHLNDSRSQRIHLAAGRTRHAL